MGLVTRSKKTIDIMFKSARVRLTLLYLLIIAFISISFSAVIYNDFAYELQSRLSRAETRLQILAVPKQVTQKLLEDELNVAKRVIILRLLVLNCAILFISGAGGYFLAGRTLLPIEEIVEDQKRFVADASHELRTPLTSLKTEIEVALRDKKMVTKDVKKLLSSNLTEIDRMKDLTNYLLSLSRYEGGSDLVMETLDLFDILSEAIEKNSPIAKKKKIKITKKLKNISVKGNRAGLVELFSILISNAINYSTPGKSISIRIYKTRRYVVVEIEDRGIGIDEADIPHIFDRFFRADQSRCKETVEGYGLGLSIAKSIADLHRAGLKVKSKVSTGTVFSVNFPSYF